MMKQFKSNELIGAGRYAAEGGQALHVWDSKNWRAGAPSCFKRSRLWAHLLDQDEERLVATARRLGVRVIKVSKRGRPSQHIDLCGKPLARAMAEAEAGQRPE